MRRRSGGTCFSAAPRWTVRRLDRVFSPLALAAVRSIPTRFQLVTRRLLRDGESAWPTRQMRTSSDCLARSPGSHLAGICGDSRPRLSSGPVPPGRSVLKPAQHASPFKKDVPGIKNVMQRRTPSARRRTPYHQTPQTQRGVYEKEVWALDVAPINVAASKPATPRKEKRILPDPPNPSPAGTTYYSPGRKSGGKPKKGTKSRRDGTNYQIPCAAHSS